MKRLPQTLTILASLAASLALAQTPSELAAAKAQYKKEVAECAVSNPVVGRADCLREARNTLAEIKHGHMQEVWRPSDYEKNALQRCDVHNGEDKLDCVARMRGLGRTAGSVAGGGIFRELATRKVVPAPVAQPVKEPEAPPPSGLMSNCRWVPPTDWVCK